MSLKISLPVRDTSAISDTYNGRDNLDRKSSEFKLELITMRKRISPELKAKAALEALKEERPLNQIAGDYEVHPNMLSAWKATAINGMSTLFEKETKAQIDKDAHDKQVEELFSQIGRLTTQLAWMKKKSGLDFP